MTRTWDKAQLAALRADKERLDWLEDNDYPGFERWSTGWGLHTHESPTLRTAIDRARGTT